MTINNVFVLCTGRCGSMSFARACSHATNYTAGHETRRAIVGPTRLHYPNDHIEIDNRLSWYLGRLDEEYGNDALYVHLWRDRDAVVDSLARREHSGIMAMWRMGVAMTLDYIDPRVVAADIVDTATANVLAFLGDKDNVMDIDIKQVDQRFPDFWRRIGAEGDLDAAMVEFSVRHNASIGVHHERSR